MASELKKWQPQAGGYGQEFRDEIQLKIDIINEVLDDVDQKIKILNDSVDNTKTFEVIEDTLNDIKNQLKTAKNNLKTAKARIEV